MRIISLNVNGIRASAKKGLFSWLCRQRADVVCLQEVRAGEEQIGERVFHPASLHGYFHPAQRKGYAGVAVYCARAPERVERGIGWEEFDAEGRYLEVRYGNVSVVSLYAPSGTSGDERQGFKYKFMDRFMPHLEALKSTGREYVICGDWNIAHKKIDLKNWRSNQDHSGFLPEERAWMDKLFGEAGFVDAFRVVNQESDQYTWWSNRGQAWAKNVGWRIDYQVITPGLADRVLGASIYKRKRFSDHAPLIIDYSHEF